MNVQRHRRRWRTPSAWFLAFLPWIIVILSLILRLAGRVEGDMWRVWAMIGLSSLFTVLVIAMWQPWKKED